MKSWQRTFRHLACPIHIRGRRHRDSQVPSFVAAAGESEIQPPADGRERCVDLVQPRAVVQVEPAIDRGRCQLRRRANSDLLTRGTRVADPR